MREYSPAVRHSSPRTKAKSHTRKQNVTNGKGDGGKRKKCFYQDRAAVSVFVIVFGGALAKDLAHCRADQQRRHPEQTVAHIEMADRLSSGKTPKHKYRSCMAAVFERCGQFKRGNP